MYKRLTERRGGLVIDNCGNCPNVNNPQGCTDKNCYEIMKNRLAELEDKIMDGTLVELPCKVGDKVWILGYNEDSDKLEIFEDTICEILVRYFSDIKVKKIRVSKFGVVGSFYFDELNREWFLTKAEAEAKLKELQK